jgi:hypothetical protein
MPDGLWTTGGAKAPGSEAGAVSANRAPQKPQKLALCGSAAWQLGQFKE